MIDGARHPGQLGWGGVSTVSGPADSLALVDAGRHCGEVNSCGWGGGRMVECGGRSGGIVGDGYAAFLQNAGCGVVRDPERCSGLGYGVPLGHGGRCVARGAGRRAPHAERAVILPAVQSLRRAEGRERVGRSRVQSLACPVLVGRGWLAAFRAEGEQVVDCLGGDKAETALLQGLVRREWLVGSGWGGGGKRLRGGGSGGELGGR